MGSFVAWYSLIFEVQKQHLGESAWNSLLMMKRILIWPPLINMPAKWNIPHAVGCFSWKRSFSIQFADRPVGILVLICICVCAYVPAPKEMCTWRKITTDLLEKTKKWGCCKKKAADPPYRQRMRSKNAETLGQTPSAEPGVCLHKYSDFLLTAIKQTSLSGGV